ncbi:MAG: hypothetical protein ACRDRH_10655 [Pseudonocardia sp.]
MGARRADVLADVRLDLVLHGSIGITVDWGPQLRLSLEPGHDPTGSVLRRGRVIGWIEGPSRRSRTPHPQ